MARNCNQLFKLKGKFLSVLLCEKKEIVVFNTNIFIILSNRRNNSSEKLSMKEKFFYLAQSEIMWKRKMNNFNKLSTL